MKMPFLILTVTGAALLSGCANKTYYIDYDAYPMLPVTGTSQTLKAVGRVSPKFQRKAFYGNYGGPGNNGGTPVDAMDRLFYDHDRAYIEGLTLDELIEADRVLVEGLKALDESTLSDHARHYRARAIKYFEKPASRFVGKPRDVRMGLRKERRAFDISEYPGPHSG